jgi:hypothetical protein
LNFWERLLNIDRRIIFLVMAVVIFIPIKFPFGLRVKPYKPSRQLFDYMEEVVPEGNNVILVSGDQDPQTEPELQPMNVAIVRHAFHRRIRVLALSLYPISLGLTEFALTQVAGEFNSRATCREDSIIYGRDYVLLGWKPPPAIPLIGMARSIRGVYKYDNYGNEVDSLEVMKGVDNYSQLDLVFAISGGTTPIWYLVYGQSVSGVPVAAGVTSVSVADYYIYLQSGQFCGLLEGMKGAAEYERMVEERYGDTSRQKATEGMSSQTTSHLAIMFFVILANVGYFASRRKRRMQQE